MFASRRCLFLFAGLVSTILLTGPVGAQKSQNAQKSTSGPTPVIASFRCPLGLDCYGTDRIFGDGQGSYTGNLGASTNVNPGDFYLTLQSGIGRFVALDFSQQSGTAPCVAAKTCQKNFTTVYADGLPVPGTLTNPVDAMGALLPNGFFSISVGQSVHARFKLDFSDPYGRSLLWTIRFNTVLYPGSGYVTVTRTSTTTWIVEAMASDVAELVSLTTARGKSVEANEGFYSMPFKIMVTQ